MLSIFFLMGLWVVGCKGQILNVTSKIFQWQFQNQAISSQLGTCIQYPIVVKPYNITGNTGVPPYYMISFAIGGIPITTPIGSDPNNLSWTLNQPAGSNLLLSVVDSTNGAGGIPPQLFSVIAGQTTQCVSTPAEPNPPFKVTANVTGDLETCQPWGITVSGGVPPYTITLAETNSPVVTNVTMDLGANRFTFPNRADPGGQLIAAISDVEGRWATGTPVVSPVDTGSTNPLCTGLVASSGNATVIDAQDAALNAQLNASEHRKSIVTGVAVTLVLLLVIGCGIMWYLRYRRRAQVRQKRVSEQRVHQYSTTDIPQTWETFDSTVRPSEVGQSAPVYEKRSRVPLPGVVSEPEGQAPPYQEVEPNAASLGRATAYGTAFAPVVESPFAMFPRNGVDQKSSQFPRPNVPKPGPSGINASLSTSQEGTETSSASTTSEMASAFPDVPISLPSVPSPIASQPGRKTSAQFVTFPRNSVRASASGSGVTAREERSQSADNTPVVNSQQAQQLSSSSGRPGMEKMTRSKVRAIEAITEEETQLPRYGTRPQ